MTLSQRPPDTQNRPRVLHLYKSLAPEVPGGVSSFITESAKALGAQFDIHAYVCRGQRGGYQRDELPGIKIERAASLGDVLSVPIAPNYVLAALPKIAAADVIHVHQPNPVSDVTMLLARLLGLLRGGKRVIVHHHADVVNKPGWLIAVTNALAWATKRIALSNAGGQRSGKILVNHRRLLDGHRAHYPADKVAEIPFFVDPDKWFVDGDPQTGQAHAALAQKYALAPRYFVAVGRLVPYKGLSVLIDAFAAYVAQSGDTQTNVCLVGKGELETALRDQANALGIGDRIQFLQGVDDTELRQLLSGALSLVMPSISIAEAFGIVQIEAMACGIPVINTQLSTSVPHIARHGHEGLTAQPGDAASLEVALTRLATDPAYRQQLANGALARTEAVYTRDRVIGQLEQLYRGPIGKGS